MLLSLGVSFLLVGASHGQVTLNQGEVYEYSFSEIPDGPFPLFGLLFNAHAGLRLGLDSTTIDGGDSIRFEFFEEGISASADHAFNLDLSSGTHYWWAIGLWGDRDGSFRLTSLSGSFTIDDITVLRGEGSGTYMHFITPVPEPSLIALGALGGAFLFARRRSRH